MSKHFMTAGITMALLVGLAGCSDFRRAVGTEKSSPTNLRWWYGAIVLATRFRRSA